MINLKLIIAVWMHWHILHKPEVCIQKNKNDKDD